jgi:hypothetical protein
MVPVYQANDVTLQNTVNHENLRAHRTGILNICGFLALFFISSVLNTKWCKRVWKWVNRECNVLSSESCRTDLKLEYCHSVFYNYSGVAGHCSTQHHHPGYSQSFIQLISMLDITVFYMAWEAAHLCKVTE